MNWIFHIRYLLFLANYSCLSAYDFSSLAKFGKFHLLSLALFSNGEGENANHRERD
jgi:hypothetical protein